MELQGRRAFLTGGGGGLGGYVLAALADAGVDIAIGYISSRERAAAAAEAVARRGRAAFPVRIDLADEASVAAGVEGAVDRLGGLDILINNAATGAPFDELTVARWDHLMAINLRGPYLTSRAAAPHLKASGAGRIVNVGAVLGLTPGLSGAHQTVSKAAVVPLTRYLAATLAPEVLVNCVAPGLMEDTLMSGGAPEDYVQGWRDMAVTGRTTAHADVAAQILTFCAADSVTGQTAVIDGGIHFH